MRSSRPLGPDPVLRSVRRRRAQALELLAPALLAALEPALDQREDRDQDREEEQSAEAEVGDDLVVGRAPQPHAVGGERGGRERRQDREGCYGDGDQACSSGAAHARNSTSGACPRGTTAILYAD